MVKNIIIGLICLFLGAGIGAGTCFVFASRENAELKSANSQIEQRNTELAEGIKKYKRIIDSSEQNQRDIERSSNTIQGYQSAAASAIDRAIEYSAEISRIGQDAAKSIEDIEYEK